MATHHLGIILNGVTGRMGTNQHLVRSILAIRDQGGVRHGDDLVTVDPILTGRSHDKLAALARQHRVEKFTTDLDAALADPAYQIFFDASGTPHRIPFLERAIAAGKHLYCEKPTATRAADALAIAAKAEAANLKNGTVQDKLWLPGIRKFFALKSQGFFGQILSARGEFGYWVFTGHTPDQPAQRPSWNYRAKDGGGIIVDMHCHWRYVIDNMFGPVTRVFTHAATHIPERIDEHGQPYLCTADDSAYALFQTASGVICQFNSSWDVRVRRDDLLTIQVDGTLGSAIVGLRKCWAQHASATPKPTWNPDIDSPINYYDGWTEVPDTTHYDNAFKIQWELFLKHVAFDTPFPYSLREGAKGVQLAELSLLSHERGTWIEVPELT
jgi:predicted dehydrogenase